MELYHWYKERVCIKKEESIFFVMREERGDT